MLIDQTRHINVFNPRKIEGQIAIIGAGSIGSHLTYNLVKLGLSDKIFVYDDDKVEAHNISNQMYALSDVGRHKVHALDSWMDKYVSQHEDRVTGVNRKVETRGDIAYEQYIFCCVDSMAARKQIFDNVVYMNPSVKYFGDGRMSATHGMCYGFNPTNLPKAKEYRKRWYPDDDVPDEIIGGCSITQSIGATAQFVAAQMTWMFINHVNGTHVKLSETSDVNMEPYEELAFRVDDLEVHSKGWL